MIRHILASGLFIGAFAVAADGARAQLAQSETCDEPLDIAGDQLEGLDNNAVLTGNVIVVQCDAVLTTARLEYSQNASGALETLTAISAVRYSNKEDAISGDRAVYDEGRRSITFTGDVAVVQGQQILTGERLVYWLDTGKFTFTAAPGQRIRGVFHTKSLDSAPL
ncbi:MAG: LptA/OstA family protein [Pseudomonadota bacterium]